MEELNNRPFLGYMAQLEERVLLQLFESKPACLAIFRMLPPLAQQCVLLLVFNSNLYVSPFILLGSWNLVTCKSTATPTSWRTCRRPSGFCKRFESCPTGWS